MQQRKLVPDVIYTGHNPHDWKLIKKWDSVLWLKGSYENKVYKIPEYQLVCGEGIVVIDDLQ